MIEVVAMRGEVKSEVKSLVSWMGNEKEAELILESALGSRS